MDGMMGWLIDPLRPRAACPDIVIDIVVAIVFVMAIVLLLLVSCMGVLTR